MESTRRLIFNADARIAFVASDNGKVTLSGYALVWNVVSTDRGGYKVRLLPGSAQFSTPTAALFNHDFAKPLGGTDNGTLRIFPDSYGVKVEIDLDDSSLGRDVGVWVKGGNVRGMSFSMQNGLEKSHTTSEAGQTIINAEKYLVDEVTVTKVPGFVEALVGIKPDTKSYAARAAQSTQLDRFKLDMMRLSPARTGLVAV
jgi:HK97 family phage prohead protease